MTVFLWLQRFRCDLLLKHCLLLCQHSFCFIFLAPKTPSFIATQIFSQTELERSPQDFLADRTTAFARMLRAASQPPVYLQGIPLWIYSCSVFNLLQFSSLPLNCLKTNLYIHVSVFCCVRLIYEWDLSSLVQRKFSLPMAEGLEIEEFKVHSNSNSMIDVWILHSILYNMGMQRYIKLTWPNFNTETYLGLCMFLHRNIQSYQENFVFSISFAKILP